MDRDAAIAAMLGGASESAAKRGGQAKRRIRTDTEPTLAATACSYYDNDSSSGLRLVQVQTVAAAAVLAPQSLVATSQELANPLKRLLHRGKEDIPDAAAVVAATQQARAKGRRGGGAAIARARRGGGRREGARGGGALTWSTSTRSLSLSSNSSSSPPGRVSSEE